MPNLGQKRLFEVILGSFEVTKGHLRSLKVILGSNGGHFRSF